MKRDSLGRFARVRPVQPSNNPTGINRKKLNPEQELEVIAKYKDPNVPMADILREYGIKATTLYWLLDREKIPRRRAKRRLPDPLKAQLEEIQQAVRDQSAASNDAAMVSYLLDRVRQLEAENATLRARLGEALP